MPQNGIRHPPPVTILPTLRCLPDFVRGIPVALEIRDFAALTPKARFQEKPPRPMKPHPLNTICWPRNCFAIRTKIPTTPGVGR